MKMPWSGQIILLMKWKKAEKQLSYSGIDYDIWCVSDVAAASAYVLQ